MKIPNPATVDFETDGIESRPSYPPEPVGVSIMMPDESKPRYYGFGHLDCLHCGASAKNNATKEQATRALKKAYASKDGVLFQNAKFDLDVADVHHGIPIPEWSRVEDTLFQIFLDDPNQQTFSLKPSAERLLDMPPEEKDAVADWFKVHQPLMHLPDESKRVKVGFAPGGKNYFMKFLRYAPADVVGLYASGDVVRTKKIHRKLWPSLVKRKMLEAYDRERELMPYLLEMERQGLPIHLSRLSKDVKFYRGVQEKVDSWLRKRIKASGEINLDSGEQLVGAMLASRAVDKRKLTLTATGKPASNREALEFAIADKALLGVLRYRAQLKTYLGTFMEPIERMGLAVRAKWRVPSMRRMLDAETAKLLASGKSLAFTSWNQVKGDGRGGSNAGARTGRVSASLFMNAPKEAAPHFKHEARDAKEAKELPKCPIPKLPPLPIVRKYVAPFAGEVIVDRDYSQQEPRILAHFDGEALLRKYLASPWIDFHDFAKAELEKFGIFLPRRPIKNANLGIIYGMGVAKLAAKNGQSIQEASSLKQAILKLYPGLKNMYVEAKHRAKLGLPVKTWGGRLYLCEKPKIIDGRLREFDYKLPNALIQGSAADCTKEAVLRFEDAKRGSTKRWRALPKAVASALPDFALERERAKLAIAKLKARPRRWRLMLTVHDQLTVSAPRSEMREAMEVLRWCMESVEFDVPMLTEGAASDDNWAEIEDTDKKGKETKRWPRAA